MRRHVFADESGCLTFARNQNVSKYFILCSIVTDSVDIGDQLQALRRDLSWDGLPVGAFHATTDKQAVRDRVFELMADMEFRIDATILEIARLSPTSPKKTTSSTSTLGTSTSNTSGRI